MVDLEAVAEMAQGQQAIRHDSLTLSLLELANQLDYPLSEPRVIASLFHLAAQIQPAAADIASLICEGRSSELISLIYEQQINRAREAAGRPPVKCMLIEDDNVERAIQQKNLGPIIGRTLLLTEYIETGERMRVLYQAVSGVRDPHSVDVATAGASEHSHTRMPWMEEESAYYFVPSLATLTFFWGRSSGFDLGATATPQSLASSYDKIDRHFQQLLGDTAPQP